MRIQELLEGKQFNDLDFVRKDAGKTELDFDLVEDIVYFLNHDDDTYRRHVYPAVHKCVEGIKRNKKVSPGVFKSAVKDGYNNYVSQFPLKELADELEDKLCEKVCEKMHEEVCKDVAEGKYKD